MVDRASSLPPDSISTLASRSRIWGTLSVSWCGRLATYTLLLPQTKLPLGNTILVAPCCLRATTAFSVSVITSRHNAYFGFFFLPGFPGWFEPSPSRGEPMSELWTMTGQRVSASRSGRRTSSTSLDTLRALLA